MVSRTISNRTNALEVPMDVPGQPAHPSTCPVSKVHLARARRQARKIHDPEDQMPFAASRIQRATFLTRSSRRSGVVFHGGLSRTQRPQFQPRLLLQCHPGPQPLAIRSTMCDIPVCNNAGPGKIAFAYASTTTEASKRTIKAEIKRSSFSVRNMEVTLAGRS